MKTSKILLFFAVLGVAMSGGVHRVAQSRWNTPQAAEANRLCLYFSLDNALPAAGYLLVGIPSTSGFTPQETGVHVWALGNTLAAPATASNSGTCTWANNVLSCTFASALTANTAYGIELTTATAMAAAGSWAPVTMETRMNKAANAGPIRDINRVFDSLNTQAAASSIALSASQVVVAPATAKSAPGETAPMSFVVSFGADTNTWVATKVVKAPWNLVLKMDNNNSRNRAQTATGTWVRDPVTYDDWTWGTTCTNTQWGVDVDASATPAQTAVTLTNKTPACKVTTTSTTYDLVIPIAQDLTATDYSTFKIKFTVDVTMPKNLIGQTTGVKAYIMDGANYQMISKSTAANILSVTKPTGQADTQATGLVSFGKDPNDSAEQLKGVGVYSTPYCWKVDAGLFNTLTGNCGLTSAATATPAVSTAQREMALVNAIEINWALPYDIPNDRTEANIICKTEQEAAANSDVAADVFAKDPLRIHQSSMIAKGWGKGNCFYLGVAGDYQTPGQHRFRCSNIGKLTKGANLQLAFQYTISNAGKVFTAGDKDTATNNIVTLVAKTLSCELKINTYTDAKTSGNANNWYTSKFTTKVDGDGQASNFGHHQSFLVTRATYASIGQNAVNNDNDLKAAAKVDVSVQLMLTVKDRTVRTGSDAATAMRALPFDPTVAEKEMYVKVYGASVESAPKVKIAIPAAASFDDTDSLKATVANGMAWELPAADKTDGVAPTSATGGLLTYKWARAAWGGNCCADNTNCAAKCDALAANKAKLLVFMSTGSSNKISHSYMKSTATKVEQAGVSFDIADMATLPAQTAGLTTLRGRGGLGSSKQKLVDFFWILTSNNDSSDSVQALLHFYVHPTTEKPDADMNVSYGFPLNTWQALNAANTLASNDGLFALSTGIKLYIATTDAKKPIADYYGFYVPRMTPFFKTSGGNEIEVLTERASVQCWSWGSENGAGYIHENHASRKNSYLEYFLGDSKYGPAWQFAGANLVICKVGKAAAGANGDVIIVPATQSVADATGVNNPLPLSTSNQHNMPTNRAGYIGATGNAAIIAGDDEYLGTMTYISDANVALSTRVPAADITGTASALPLGSYDAQGALVAPNAYGTSLQNSNAGGAGTWDLTGKTASEYVIGVAKLDALISWKHAATAEWSDDQAVATICNAQAGAVIPADTVIHAGDGKAASNPKCTTAFLYTTGLNDISLTSAQNYQDRKQRMCRWCSGKGTATLGKVYLVDYKPPTTSTRKVKGVTIWASDDAGAGVITVDTYESSTLQESVAIASGGCGKAQETKKDTKGQSVEFTIKSPVPLAAGQYVFWQSSDAKEFQLSSVTANSVECTCGSYTFVAGAFTKVDGTNLRLQLPAAASGATSEEVCVAGDLSCKLRDWTSGATDVEPITGICFACDSNSAVCTKDNSKTAGSSGKGVARYVDTNTFEFKQKGAQSVDVLKVKDFAFQPNSKNAVGRFYFKPQTGVSLYAAESKIDYTFGAQSFGTGALCQVFTSNGNMPSTTMSDLVSVCAVDASKVTVTMAKTGSANFHVQLTGIPAFGAAAGKITGNVINFGTTVSTTDADAAKQIAMVEAGTAAGQANTPATLTVTLKRTLVNVMDVGMVEFTITPKTEAFGNGNTAWISFPTYYNPNIGSMLRCSLYDTQGNKDGERLYCNVAWDYTLRVMGPSTDQKKDTAFALRVYGVQMNSFATAGNFGVGLTNAKNWTNNQLVDFATVTDGTSGQWQAKLPIDVTSVTLSNNNLRSTTDITAAFTLPTTSDTVTAASDFIAMTLPYQWMGVHSWADGTATASASLKLVTTQAGKTTKSAVKGAVVQVSGCTVVFQLDTTATKLVETGSYEFVLSGVPTTESASGAANMNLGSVVISVGKVADGGRGWSSAALFPALSVMTVPSGKNLLEFQSAMATVSRGTYSKDAVCIQPASGNFKSDVAVSVQGSVFKTNPASISAKMGAARACADMGTAATTQTSVHNVRWTVNNGTALYTNLPTQMVTVNSKVATVTVPDKVTCSLSGSSVPIVVTADAVPFSDIKVSLEKSIATDEAKTDNSVGITVNAGEVVTLKVGTNQGVLGFACAATVTGKELKYKLDGTDKAQFSIIEKVSVTAQKAGTKPATPAMKLAMVADKSTASKTTIEGECPGLGGSWIGLTPLAQGDKVLSAVADVRAAHAKFVPGAEGAHAQQQWCYRAVAATGAKTSCEFASASKAQYYAALYCETIEGWFFASTKAVNVTAKDNGGKPVSLSLTYSKAISDITDNAVVLNICGKLAESLAVPYARVTDAYGGYFGNPSPSLPTSAPAAATTNTTTTNTTTNKTRLLNTTTNATNTTTKPAQTSWVINLFVQPDPFADKVDNAATVTAATAPTAVAAVDGVTKAKFGAATAKAVAVSEVAVKFVTAPAATGGNQQVTIAGSTDVGAYVYCAVSKTASRRRMLNTTNSSATANTTAAPAKAAEPVNLQSSATAAKYHVQRQETKTGALSFSLVFKSLNAGATYSWMCEATSLSPSNPAFRTAMSKGNVATSAPPAPSSSSDSALWSSLFAAVLMIAAVFFY